MNSPFLSEFELWYDIIVVCGFVSLRTIFCFFGLASKFGLLSKLANAIKT